MASVDSKDHSKDDSTTRVGQAWAHPAMQFLLETLCHWSGEWERATGFSDGLGNAAKSLSASNGGACSLPFDPLIARAR